MRRPTPPVRRVARLALPFAALTLAACAPLGPDYARPAQALPSAWSSGSATQAVAAAVRPEWWRLYKDPMLDDLVASARSRNADVLIAAAQLQEAEAVLREAHAALFPQIDLGAGAARSRISTLAATPLPPTVAPVRSDFRLSASTAFELDFWGRLRRTEEAVRAQALASRHARDVADISVAASTAQAYFLLRALDAQIANTQTSLKLRQETLEIARSRAQAGLVSDLEVAQAEGLRADAASQALELQRQRAQVLTALGVLSGRPGLALSPGDLRSIPVPPTPPAGLPSELLDRRPDVLAAEQGLVAANARVGVAKAAMMPSISLTGAYGGQSRDLADLLARGARIWSLGLGVSLPIFDAGRLSARTEQAQARREQALAAYRKSAENAFREVADALSGVALAGDAETALQARVDAARRAERLARLRWEAGHSPYLEFLDAQRVLNDAQTVWLRNRQSRLALSVDLMKALGGGWSAQACYPPACLNGERSESSSR